MARSNSHRPTALVTGGAGFIGSHLTEALIESGFRVRVLDDLSSGYRANLAACPTESLEFWEGSITDAALLRHCLEGVELVFHLAAMVAVPLSVEQPRLCLELNDLAVFNLYEAAAAAGVRRLVLSSSSAVYGDLAVPHHEGLCPRPDTPYAIHKLLAEHYGLYFYRYRGLESVYLRYFNVYGQRQRADSPYSGVISLFMESLKNGQPATIFGDGLQKRDFVHVSDVVRANLAAAFEPNVAGRAFNIGSGSATAIGELYAILSELTGQGHLKPRFALCRPGDIKYSEGPVSEAAQRLKWKAQTSLAQGLALTWRWFVSGEPLGSVREEL